MSNLNCKENCDHQHQLDFMYVIVNFYAPYQKMAPIGT